MYTKYIAFVLLMCGAIMDSASAGLGYGHQEDLTKSKKIAFTPDLREKRAVNPEFNKELSNFAYENALKESLREKRAIEAELNEVAAKSAFKSAFKESLRVKRDEKTLQEGARKGALQQSLREKRDEKTLQEGARKGALQ